MTAPPSLHSGSLSALSWETRTQRKETQPHIQEVAGVRPNSGPSHHPVLLGLVRNSRPLLVVLWEG